MIVLGIVLIVLGLILPILVPTFAFAHIIVVIGVILRGIEVGMWVGWRKFYSIGAASQRLHKAV